MRPFMHVSMDPYGSPSKSVSPCPKPQSYIQVDCFYAQREEIRVSFGCPVAPTLAGTFTLIKFGAACDL